MNNLELYNRVRNVPQNAKKTIGAGRLKGMTDINPMWRIKTLTENFGVCGIGWKTQIVRTWNDSGANGEMVTNVEILLYVKVDNAWSEGIPGIGGSKLVAKESAGLYTDDESYKKAYTDALSVACKAIGIGADVYWDKDDTKYDNKTASGDKGSSSPRPVEDRNKTIEALIKDTSVTWVQVNEWVEKSYGKKNSLDELTEEQYQKLETALRKKKGENG